MASRTPTYDATPLDVLLASVPSLPRAILARLTASMIERLDELEGDSDRDPDLRLGSFRTSKAGCLPSGDFFRTFVQ